MQLDPLGLAISAMRPQSRQRATLGKSIILFIVRLVNGRQLIVTQGIVQASHSISQELLLAQSLRCTINLILLVVVGSRCMAVDLVRLPYQTL